LARSSSVTWMKVFLMLEDTAEKDVDVRDRPLVTVVAGVQGDSSPLAAKSYSSEECGCFLEAEPLLPMGCSVPLSNCTVLDS